MKYLIGGLIACGPTGLIVGIWSGSVDEGAKAVVTGFILFLVGMGLAMREDTK